MNQSENSRQLARKSIQAAGLRATPARVATLVVLLDAEAPLTHSDVAATLEESGFDKATIFRNLTDMVAANLLRRSELGDRVWRFEFIRDPEHGAHPHFVCVDCGTVSCAEEIELSPKSKSASQLFGTVTEILLRGHCNDCG